jgi:hypothetical protein
MHVMVLNLFDSACDGPECQLHFIVHVTVLNHHMHPLSCMWRFWTVTCILYRACDSSEPSHARFTILVVIAGSKGKERFRRPLRMNSNIATMSFLSTCCSSFGAGVPAEAKWRWFWHVLDEGSTCFSLSSYCRSGGFIFWPCLGCVHNTMFWLRHQTASFFLSPTILYHIILVKYLYLDKGSHQAPSPNQKIRGIRNADFCCC